mgnify:CR=1 FL=1
MAKTIIDMKGIVKKFYIGQPNELTILKGIDLTVEEGEFLSIVGQSGSGKSTLMNIIGALDRPTEGEYLLDDIAIDQAGDGQLSSIRNEKIGFVFQTFNLIPRTSALKNVELPMLYAGMPRSKRTARAKQLLGMVQMEERMDHMPNELSGGQKQRVAIARAMANDPAIILADEPTGNLDSTTSRQVLYSMLEMAKSYGITFVMVTHEKELAYCGDRIVTIKDGRVLDNVLLGEDEKAENRRRLFGDVTSGDIAEPETTVAEGKKPAARQAKAVAAAVAEKVNQESM